MRINVVLFVIVLFAVATVSAFSQALTPAQEELVKYIRDNYDKTEVMIPMRDGVSLGSESGSNRNADLSDAARSQRVVSQIRRIRPPQPIRLPRSAPASTSDGQ